MSDQNAVLSTEVRQIVAQYLAEAGAVHPKMHTPDNVSKWLKSHGWTSDPAPDPGSGEIIWANGKAREHVYVPLNTENPYWDDRMQDVLFVAAACAKMEMEKVLLEIAMMPGEKP